MGGEQFLLKKLLKHKLSSVNDAGKISGKTDLFYNGMGLCGNFTMMLFM